MASNPDGLQPNNFSRKAKKIQILMLGSGLIMLAVLLAYLFVLLWPSPSDFSQKISGSQKQMICSLFVTSAGGVAEGKVTSASGVAGDKVTSAGGATESKECFEVTLDARLLMLVMVAGGLGSFVHTAKSFGDFVGNDKLMSSWIWWYILKPFIGMILATIFYLVIRGGFLSVGNDAGNLNLYSITAMACMAGMFAKQATDKLSEIFDSLFKTSHGGGDAKRKDNLDNPIPTVVDIQPSSASPKTQQLVLNGLGFLKSSVVRVNDTNRETRYIGDKQLIASLLPEDVAKEGVLNVSVFNPLPGGGISNTLNITVSGAIGLPSNDLNVAPNVQDDNMDGCDGVIESETADKDLPPSTGGVAS
ncbi:hypothetical protein [Pseudomonas sp. GL-RE-20]|uniref:hypothetical protein n=1 Tax=Pseudomonas sp. GL-RE-20 TaxID=2832372 RepID=UPI001CBD4311|nr:hypothetical protein [Pseudomonas sp. GL-RE-20]